MDPILLSRIQFAFTVAFHYIFPPLSIGLGLFLVIVEGRWMRGRNPVDRQIAKFWTRIFGLIFAIGVASGIVMEFQFGTNWSSYSRFVGDVFGSALAAECDPYALCHACAASAAEHGAGIYENTPVDEILCERGGCALHTRTGRTVRADTVILAAGEETAKRLSGIAGERTDFSVVTSSVADFAGWPNQALITEFGHPGVWMRTTPDRRILASGLSCGMASLQKLSAMLNVEVFMKKKTSELTERLRAMFPGIRGLNAEYRYAMNYVTTADGLPVLGPDAQDNLYYCLCTGENGLACALFGSRLLLEQYGGKEPDLSLFSPDR